MDPFSLLLLSGVLAALLTKTVGAAATDVAAQVRGQTPPSLEKWKQRQAARAARGEAPEREPGPWLRRWRNAVEHRSAKAAQKHTARMEFLRDNGRDNVNRHKAKLARRAQRWDAIGSTVAGWGQDSWEAAKNAAAQAKDARDERKAWKKNEQMGEVLLDADLTPQDLEAADPNTPAETPGEEEGPEADVLPFRRPEQAETPSTEEDSEQHGEDQDPHPTDPDSTDTTTEGTPQMSAAPTTQNSSTEITDLDTAISYSTETARYADTVAGTLADIVGQIDGAVQGLQAEATQYDQAKSKLVEEGFGQKVTSKLDAAAEALQLAVETLKTARDRVTASSEQVSSAGTEMRAASRVFSDQLAVAETVGAAQQDAGVSRRTSFYSPTA
ncbi:hypothetical protein GCM10010174_80880 [Kutzneria viridogrisea]|uniref:Uncharacterized protein n=1 Tax=Kutzneria viridogrisea TaxID=47990 RepID=A0ABR6BZ12_9PSEU|nr:hypothetical protein [Kutzneria viridogrisea]